MLGILLMTAGTSLEELSTTIGKSQLKKRIETPWSYGVLVLSVTLLIFLLAGLVRFSAQHFDPASIPTMAVRAVLEIFQAVVSIYAVKMADRSTYGFLRTLTIPGLLMVDVALAYKIGASQFIGIFLSLALCCCYF